MSMQAIFGEGKVADIIFWENKILSAAILSGFTTIWLLLEVLERHFVTLISDILMFTMVVIFVWYHAAGVLIHWLGVVSPNLASYLQTPPDINDIRLPESTFRYFFENIDLFLFKFFEISSGNDLKLFFLAMACLWMSSIIGEYLSALSLFYIIIVLVGTLPALYEQYGSGVVDEYAADGIEEVKKLWQMFDSQVLAKIPRRNSNDINTLHSHDE